MNVATKPWIGRNQMNSPLNPVERFWEKVSIKNENECWEWQGARHRDGYGNTWVGRKCFLAHRYSWSLAFGEIPDGLCVCHHCDNRLCVNPKHLFLGTNDDNIQDRMAKGRKSGASQPGERNPAAKLKQKDIPKIHELRATGLTQKAIAERMGVSETAIYHVLNRICWTK